MMYSQPPRPPAPSNQVALYQSPQQFLQQQYGQVRREREGGKEGERGRRKREREREGGRENPYIMESIKKPFSVKDSFSGTYMYIVYKYMYVNKCIVLY